MSEAIFTKGAAPATPDAGRVTLYVKADGRFYFKDESGTEVPMKTTGAGTGDLLSDGSVALTADWDVGSYKITAQQLESDIATGTAPLIVASTTAVPNLNADQVDGKDASDFVNDTDYTAKGDILIASAASTPAVLGVGTDTHVLTADSGEATGVKWAAASSGGEFAEIATAQRNTGDLTTTSTSFVDVTDLTVTLTTAAVRCMVMASGTFKNSASGNTAIDIDIDGTRMGETLGLVFTNQNVNKPFSFTVMTDVLTAASHTIKLVWKVQSGTGTIYANSATSPVKLTVLETSMTT